MKKGKVADTEKIADEEKTEKTVDAAPVITETGGGLADVLENKNEVVPEAVEKARESAAAPKEELTDDEGNKFNPEIHLADAGGKPIINSRGYITKKRGRKKGCTPNQKLHLPDGKAATLAQEAEQATVKRQQAAYISGVGFINIGVLIFGEEWLPEKAPVDETGMIVQAFDDYYKVKGVADIPPGIALVIALGGYGIKRFAKPVTKTKLQLIAGSVIERVKGFFNRIRGKKGTVKNVAHSDSRHDENGKDDLGGGTRPAQ